MTPLMCLAGAVLLLLLPTMASVGQALMQRVQPMHQFSSITARVRGASAPLSGLSGNAGRPVIAARRTTPSCPPGGHWLMGAPSDAIATA